MGDRNGAGTAELGCLSVIRLLNICVPFTLNQAQHICSVCCCFDEFPVYYIFLVYFIFYSTVKFTSGWSFMGRFHFFFCKFYVRDPWIVWLKCTVMRSLYYFLINAYLKVRRKCAHINSNFVGLRILCDGSTPSLVA